MITLPRPFGFALVGPGPGDDLHVDRGELHGGSLPVRWPRRSGPAPTSSPLRTKASTLVPPEVTVLACRGRDALPARDSLPPRSPTGTSRPKDDHHRHQDAHAKAENFMAIPPYCGPDPQPPTGPRRGPDSLTVRLPEMDLAGVERHPLAAGVCAPRAGRRRRCRRRRPRRPPSAPAAAQRVARAHRVQHSGAGRRSSARVSTSRR